MGDFNLDYSEWFRLQLEIRIGILLNGDVWNCNSVLEFSSIGKVRIRS